MATPIRVLIVEDSEDDAAALVRELRRADYDVTFDVIDTSEGMAASLADKGWDIVISDYDMPRFSSSAALSLLRETEVDIPFIILSGVIGEEVAVEAMRAGAQDYIFKGNVARLVPAIQRELQDSARRRQHSELESMAEQLLETQERAVRSEGLRRQELETLFNIASILVDPGLFQPKYQEVLDKLARIAQADLATLRVLDEKGQTLNLLAQAGTESFRRTSSLPLNSVSGTALLQSEAVVVNDYLAHPRVNSSEVEHGTRSLVSLPIKVGAGKPLGVVNVVSNEPDHFTPDLINVLTAIVGGLGVLLDQAKIFNEFEASMESMALVDEIAGNLTSNLDINLVYQELIFGLGKLIEFDRMYVSLLNRDDESDFVHLLFGEPRPSHEAGATPKPPTEQMQQAIETGRPVIREDFESGPRLIEDQVHLKMGLRSSIVVPLINMERRIGVIELLSSEPSAFGHREQSTLVRFALRLKGQKEGTDD